MKIKLSALRTKVIAGIHKLGYQGEDAAIIADVLLYAQLRGNNQGITKIATGGVPNIADTQPLTVAKQNKCGVLLSGGNSMVVAAKAAGMAVDLAKEHGVGIVSSNHTFNSSGAIGYFARQIAERGYIGFVSVGNGKARLVAPAGSAEAALGTNPFAYAFPYDGGNVVFDTATAAMAYFGILEAKLKGEALPAGVGFNKAGQPSTDPAEVLEGAIAPFAGHKGFGLSLFVQLMGSAFSLSGIPGAHEEDGAGIFVLAIDPGLFAGQDEFMKRSTELVQSVKSVKPLPGQNIILPGERGDALAAQAEQSGEIEVADTIWQELVNFVDA